MDVAARRYAIIGVVALALLCLAPALLAAEPASAQGAAILVVEPAEVQVQPGQEFDLDLVAYGVTEAYAFEVLIVFEPGYLEVVDQDPVMLGAQVTIDPGFLSPDFLLQNEADNALGTLEVAYNQVPPSPAATGDGRLLSMRMRALQAGTVYVKLDDVLMAREDSSRMLVGSRSAEVLIGDAPVESTPTETASPTPEATFTPVPSDTPALPTETPTLPVETPTSASTFTPVPQTATPTMGPSVTPGVETPELMATPAESTFESPLATPTGLAEEGTFVSPLATPTAPASPEAEPSATATREVTATPAPEASPPVTPTAARTDPAAEEVQRNTYQSLAFIAVVVGIIIVSYALFVVLPRGRKGRA